MKLRPATRMLRTAAALAACAAAFPACRVHYSTGFTPPRPIVVTAEPPPAQPEEKPDPPFEGAVWIEGHHEWTAEGWVWLPGSYVRPRAGHRWVSPRYEHFGGRVRYIPGYWEPVPEGATTATPPSPPPPTVVEPGPPAPEGTLEVQGRAVEPAGSTVETIP